MDPRRVQEALGRYVEDATMLGFAALVAEEGQAQVVSAGVTAFGASTPMTERTIFRLASLTKPIGAVLAMVLVEDGRLTLDAPVDRWLPELARPRVLRAPGADLDDTEPARRAIRVVDLLDGHLGTGAVLAPPGTLPIQRAEEELELRTFGPPWPPTPLGPDDWLAALATLPLQAQPGSTWHYNTGMQVLGVLLERAAGQPVAELLRERLCEPLGMRDTGFHVPPGDVDRLCEAYDADPATGEAALLDPAAGGWWTAPPAMPSLASGLVSTLADYWAFVQMLLGGGELDGRRVLSPSSVAALVADRLGEPERRAAGPFFAAGESWGLGVGVPAAGGAARGLPVGVGWAGGTGTTWRSDLRTGRTGILFTQRAMTSPEAPDVVDSFWRAIA